MFNPIYLARSRLGLTQAQLANQSNLTVLSIIRHEQGLPAVPSGKIAMALNLDYESFKHDYRSFQNQQRLIAAASINEIRHLAPSVDSFKVFRRDILKFPSLASFCVSFCVHQAGAYAYEEFKQRSMPVQLREALTESRLLSRMLCDELEKRNAETFDAREQRAKAS